MGNARPSRACLMGGVLPTRCELRRGAVDRELGRPIQLAVQCDWSQEAVGVRRREQLLIYVVSAGT